MPEEELPGGSFDACVGVMEDQGNNTDAAEDICGALLEETKSEHGNVEELKAALDRGAGLIADVGVDLVSGVDVPAVDSKWVMTKSGGGRRGHDWRAESPVLLSKQDDKDQRIAYAAAMIPREPDKEGDVVATPTVEKAAHDFLKQGGGVDTDHSLIDGEGEVVESWVLKQEREFDLPGGATETYQAGTWMVGIEWEKDAWGRIQDGDLTGLSIYGMAEHVPLGKSAAPAAKGLTVPFADEVVVDLVYGAEVAAEKAADELGMDAVAHEHELDGRTVFMPGPDHETYVETYNDIAEASEGVVSQATGDTHKSGDGETGDMAQDTADDGGDGAPDGGESADDGGDPTIGEVAASVADLSDNVAELKDAVETDKQDAQEAAAALSDEFGMRPGDVMDVLEMAQGSDPDDVLQAIESLGASAEEVENESDGGDEEEEEMSAEKRAADANLSKGSDATETAQPDASGEGTGLSYRAVAENQGDI